MAKSLENLGGILPSVTVRVHDFLLLLVLAILTEMVHSQQSQFAFQHISIEQGLSHARIRTIMQDSRGFLWIGTDYGLNRYDGRSFKIFIHDPADSLSLSGTSVFTIYEDHSKTLWIGTIGSGLYKIDLKPQKYRHYTHQAGDPASLIDDDIQLFHEDRQGLLWIATRNSGLDRFDPAQEIFTHFRHDPTNQHSLNHNAVRVILEDSDGYIWAGTPAGLNRIDPHDDHVDRFFYEPTEIIDPAEGATVEALYEDRSGTLWIGTYAGNLHRFDRESKMYRRFTVPIEADETRTNEILDIYEDHTGNLWIAAWKALYRFDRRNEEFIRIKAAAADDNGKLGEKIYRDRNKNIWGLNRALSTIDLTTFTVIRYRPFPNVLRVPAIEIKYNKPNGFFEDDSGMFWCGTRMGLHKFDPQQRKFISHYFERDGLLSNYVLQITGDDFGNIWILTNRGISIFRKQNPPGEQFISLGVGQGISNTPTSNKAFLKSKAGDIYWGG